MLRDADIDPKKVHGRPLMLRELDSQVKEYVHQSRLVLQSSNLVLRHATYKIQIQVQTAHAVNNFYSPPAHAQCCSP